MQYCPTAVVQSGSVLQADSSEGWVKVLRAAVMAAPCGNVRADSSDEEPPRLCCSDDSECEDNVLRQPQAPQPPHAQHAEQLHTLHDDNDSMPELVSGESSENEAPVRGQATNRLASLSTGEDHADSDGWTTAEDEEAEGAHMIEGDLHGQCTICCMRDMLQ